jgi:hypothetical protein
MAAAATLAEGHDGRIALPCMFGSGAGVWQPLPGQACDPSPWVAYAKPFVLESPSQFRTAGPYELTVRSTRPTTTRSSCSARSTAQHAPPTRLTLPRSGRRTRPRTTTLSRAVSSTSSRSM